MHLINPVSHSPSMSTDGAADFPAGYESLSRDIQAVSDRSLHHAKASKIPPEQHSV